MGNVLAGAALVVVIVYAVYSIVQKIRHGSSCCGGHEPADKKIKVTDKNKGNYPYSYILRVDGMYCMMIKRIEFTGNSKTGQSCDGCTECGTGKKTCDGCMPKGGFQNMGVMWEVVDDQKEV